MPAFARSRSSSPAAELGEHKGVSTLLARADGSGVALALLCTAPWRDATVGFAAHAAHAVLLRGDHAVRAELVDAWEHWNAGLYACRVDGETPRLWTRSTTVLKTLEAKRASGGRVAALSTRSIDHPRPLGGRHRRDPVHDGDGDRRAADRRRHGRAPRDREHGARSA